MLASLGFFLIIIEEIPWCLIIYNVNRLFIAAIRHNNRIFNC